MRSATAAATLRVRGLLCILFCAPTFGAAFSLETLPMALSGATNAYAEALVVKPLETKVASACVLAVAGDAIAQSRVPGPYDTKRASSFVAFDALYRGAFQHYAFPIISDASHGETLRAALNALMITGVGDDLLTAAERTGINQLVIVPIVYYPLFFAITGAVQGLTSEQSLKRAQDNFAPLLSRNLLFWLPTQFVQFYYVEPEWQVTYVCVAGLVWNVILSALAGDAGEQESDEAEQLVVAEEPRGVVVPAAIAGLAERLTGATTSRRGGKR